MISYHAYTRIPKQRREKVDRTGSATALLGDKLLEIRIGDNLQLSTQGLNSSWSSVEQTRPLIQTRAKMLRYS